MQQAPGKVAKPQVHVSMHGAQPGVDEDVAEEKRQVEAIMSGGAR